MANQVYVGSDLMAGIDSEGCFQWDLSVYIFPQGQQSQRHGQNKKKNWKESILKNAKLIKKLIHTIADVGTKSANCGNTIGYTPSKQYQLSIRWFLQIFTMTYFLRPHKLLLYIHVSTSVLCTNGYRNDLCSVFQCICSRH